MSRFFAASSSGSGSDSDSSNSDVSLRSATPAPAARQPKRAQYSSSDDDSDQKTAVVSQSTKLSGEVLASSRAVLEGVKGEDWVSVLGEFEGLRGKKYAGVLQTPPPVYIKAMAMLEDAIKVSLNDKRKIAVKKLNATVAKALNALNQKVRKHNVSLSSHLLAFRENPSAYDDNVVSDSDDSVFGRDSGSDSSSEDERQGLTGRSRWLKKVKHEKTNEELFAKNPKQRQQKAQAVTVDNVASEERGAAMFVDISVDTLYKKLAGVIETRGKRGTDRLVQIQILRQLLVVAESEYQKVKVLLTLVPAQFDFAATAAYMTTPMWQDVAGDVKLLLKVVEASSLISLSEDAEPQEDDSENERVLRAGGKLILPGNIASYIDRLDREFTKALQAIDHHSQDYLARLSLEPMLYSLVCHAQLYFFTLANTQAEAQMMMTRLEHLYSKPSKLVTLLESSLVQATRMTVDALATHLYAPSLIHLRTRTILLHTTHHALNSPYQNAKHMLLTSAIHDTILSKDIPHQALYNRLLMHLATSAFACGKLKDASMLLHEIHYGGKVKELLAQDAARYAFDRTAEQEKIDRARQFPFHQWINVELIECMYLTASMILEMPVLAAPGTPGKRKHISKPFRRFLEQQEKICVQGVKGYKEAISRACKDALCGEYTSAINAITSIKLWSGLKEVDTVRTMLEKYALLSEEVICRSVREMCVGVFIVKSVGRGVVGVKEIAQICGVEGEFVNGVVLDMVEKGLVTVEREDDYLTVNKCLPEVETELLNANGEDEHDHVIAEEEVNY